MSYEEYIAECKKKKDKSKVEKIIKYMLIGIRKGYSSKMLARRLNEFKILSLVDKKWTAPNVQMHILKMRNEDPKSSLAKGLKDALSEGWATQGDIELLMARCR